MNDLVALLQEHGAAAAAVPLVESGTALRRLTLESGEEFLATFDVESGVALGQPLHGRRGEVDARAHLRAMRRDRRYASVHTHAQSTSFSVADAIILTRTPELIAVIVAGSNGTWYALSKPAEVAVDHLEVALAFGAALSALQPRYRSLVEARQMRPGDAERELLHALWSTISSPLGLRYDRFRESD